MLDDLRLDGPGWRTSPVCTLDEVMELGVDAIAKQRRSTYVVGRPGFPPSSEWVEESRPT